MKKWLCAALAGLLMLPAAGCKKDSVDIAMIIADKGTFNDGSFHSGIWSGIERYAQEKNMSCAYYESETPNEEGYLAAMDKAVKVGADVLVTPGAQLQVAVYKAQEAHPDTGFIYIDNEPRDSFEDNAKTVVADNTYAVMYAEQQAGFLAGYAAVRDGFTKLGFYGGKQIPPVVRFGYGYIQGAQTAAAEMGLAEQAIELRYLYSGSFEADPKHQAKANTWYQSGTEVIFACGGGVGDSIMASAKSNNAWVIGVDTDQSGDSDRVIVSAVKNLSGSVYDALAAYFGGTFPGGKSVHLGIDADGVGLTMDTARLRSFDKAAYEAVYARLAADEGGVASAIPVENAALDSLNTPQVRLVAESI